MNGQAIITRRVVEDERVITWTLNSDRIEAELTSRAVEGGPQGEAALVKEILAANDFSQVERFFDMVESSTAPQGVGYHVRMRVLGNIGITHIGLDEFYLVYDIFEITFPAGDQIIHYSDGTTLRNELSAYIRPDKPGSAGNQVFFHLTSLIPKVSSKNKFPEVFNNYNYNYAPVATRQLSGPTSNFSDD